MKSNIYKFTRTFIIFLILCIPSLSSCKTNTDDTSPTEVIHNFQMQRLYYEEPSTTCRGYTLQVKVFADGYSCINCGTKYHTNEIWKCYRNGQEYGSNLSVLYISTGLNKYQAAALASKRQVVIKNHLYDYYYSLGYEKTSYNYDCKK